MSRLPDAQSTLQECPWAHKGQWKVFSRRLNGTHRHTANSRDVSSTIRLLATQQTVYTDGSVKARTRDDGAGIMVSCDDQADPSILH